MDARDHWAGLHDLVHGVGLVGGPSWNLRMLKRGAELVHPDAQRSELIWLAGVYSACYSVHTTLQIWDRFNYLELISDGGATMRQWLDEHRDGITIRKERLRTHGDNRRLTIGLVQAAEWAQSETVPEGDDYDAVWADLQSVPGVGRYFGIKTAGLLNVLELTNARQYDLRPAGARQGRKTIEAVTGVDRKAPNAEVNEAALDIMQELAFDDLPLDWLELESLLCEYQQMSSGSLYPGKSTDTDRAALEKSALHFGQEDPVVNIGRQLRSELLPKTAVDVETRKTLQPLYRDHGFVWSDSFYEQGAKPHRPVVRSSPWVDKPLRTRPKEVEHVGQR